MTISIVSKLLILFHLKSLQSVTSSNNQIYNLVMFLWNIYYCHEKCYFFNEGTFTRTSSVQDERDILK